MANLDQQIADLLSRVRMQGQSISTPSAPPAPLVTGGAIHQAPGQTAEPMDPILASALAKAAVSNGPGIGVQTPNAHPGIGRQAVNAVKNGYNHLHGAFEGFVTPFDQTMQDLSKHAGGGAKYLLPDLLSFLKDIPQGVKGAAEGLIHPDQAAQAWQQQTQQEPTADRFVANMVADPLMYVPFGKVAEVTGITPAMKYIYDLARGRVKTKAAEQVAKTIADVAKPAAETTPEEAAAINRRAGITGGYIPRTQSVVENLGKKINLSRKAPIAGKVATAVFRNQAHEANRTLQNLFDYAGTKQMPPGREYEYLQELLSHISPREGKSLDQLLTDLNGHMTPEELLTQAMERNKQAYKYGALNLPMKDATRTVEKAIQEEPNFIMRGGPLAVVPQATEDTAKFARGPYAAYDWQSKLGGGLAKQLAEQLPNGFKGVAPALNWLSDTLGKTFTKFYGASPAMAEALRNAETNSSVDLTHIINHMKNLQDTHGLSDKEMRNVIRHMEGVGKNPLSTKESQAVADLQDVLKNGITTPDGKRILGLQHELATGAIDPKTLIDNYFPHIYKNGRMKINRILGNNESRVLNVNGPFTKERKFATVGQAIKAGLKPETNPYIAIAHRLADSSKAIRNIELLNKVRNEFALNPSAVGRGLKELKTTGDTGAIPEGFQTDHGIPQLNGHAMRPGDAAALKSFIGKRSPSNNPLLRGYRAATRLFKQGMFFNPMVHTHNIVYNGMYLAGAKPHTVASVMKDLVGGKVNHWVEEARKAGAISADRGGFDAQIRSVLNKSGLKGSPIYQKLGYALHGSLWDLDKALRAAVYKDAIDAGMSSAEAAKRVNHFLVDYNNLTPTEEMIMANVFPFYRWLKGNMPLQVKTWLMNTPKQEIAKQFFNAISQSLSGQSMTEDGKIDTGIPIGNGSHLLIDPYIPSMEPLKLLNEGVPGFLYNRSNPILKEVADQITNQKYYPFKSITPTGESGLSGDSQTITKGKFAPASYNAKQRATHVLDNLFSPAQGAVGNAINFRDLLDQASGNVPQDKGNSRQAEMIQFLTRLLGGFTSKTNPNEQYFQGRDNQEALKQYIQYLYSTGADPAEIKKWQKEAYKKLHYQE